ncbi:MAG TPA: PA14 domain-containing protein, partial [Mucilaginibacter sp.]
MKFKNFYFQSLVICLAVFLLSFCAFCGRTSGGETDGINSFEKADADSLQSVVRFSFKLDTSANTSAGVYSKTGRLLKTLWSNVRYTKGAHQGVWDGTDQYGRLLANGVYEVRVLSNNVRYTWEGVIGNTSDSMTGPSVHQGMSRICGMAITGNSAYYVTGYNERHSSTFKFSLQKPQMQINPTNNLKDWGMSAQFVSTDGRQIYWAGVDPFTPNKWFVYATDKLTNKDIKLQAGVNCATKHGRAYASAIDLTDKPGGDITGMCVQKTGRYLLICHKKLNEIHVLDKNTGQLVKTVSVSSPQSIDIDSKGTVYLIYDVGGKTTAGQFRLDADGNMVSQHRTFQGLESPLALAVSPDDKQVVIADGSESQQIKAYNSQSGAPLWVFGEKNGYRKNALVTDNKFYFSDQREQLATFIAFENNGSFWVGDPGNDRVQHYAADRSFIERIMLLPTSYSTSVDPNDPDKVFSDYLEFKVDYSKPLNPSNGSWKLEKNWGAQVPSGYDNGYVRLKTTVTLNNHHTYTVLPLKGKGRMEIVELTPADSLRFTGVYFPADNSQLYPDGSIRSVNKLVIGRPIVWTKRALEGFDQLNNPNWGREEILATSPPATKDDPGYWGNGMTLRAGEVTGTGILVSFDGGLPPNGSEGWHLGGIKLGTSEWLWRTAPSTLKKYAGEYPRNDSYDIGNGAQYGGSVALAIDNTIFWGYHGEFWKASQVNKWNQVSDDGLLIGQFGEVGSDHFNEPAPAGMAGNSFSASVVKDKRGNIYLYHNDESYHSGVHRWKISGLNSLKEQHLQVQLDIKDHGLLAQYFSNSELDNASPPTIRIDSSVNFNWQGKIALAGGHAITGNYSISWTGYVKPLHADVYNFSIARSAKARLWVDGKLIIDHWNAKDTQENSGAQSLDSGYAYPIRMEIAGTDKPMNAQLSWSSKSQAKEIIPASHLIPAQRPAKETDLMEFIPFNGILENDLYGWTRDPAAEDYSAGYSKWWSVQTSVKKFDPFQPPDIFVKYRQNTGNYALSRDLGNNSDLKEWAINGNINFEKNYSNEDDNLTEKGNGGSFIEVLDKHGKVITRWFPHIDY